MLISKSESVEYQIEGSQRFTLVIIWVGVYPLIYRDREYSFSKNLMTNIGRRGDKLHSYYAALLK